LAEQVGFRRDEIRWPPEGTLAGTVDIACIMFAQKVTIATLWDKCGPAGDGEKNAAGDYVCMHELAGNQTQGVESSRLPNRCAGSDREIQINGSPFGKRTAPTGAFGS